MAYLSLQQAFCLCAIRTETSICQKFVSDETWLEDTQHFDEPEYINKILQIRVEDELSA